MNIVLSILLFDPEVTVLINQLGHPSFNTRQQTQIKLENMEERAIFQVLLATNNVDAEIVLRANRILNNYYNISPSHYPKMPCLIYLPDSYPNSAEIFLKYRSEAIYKFNFPVGYDADWAEMRCATRLFAIDLLKQGVPKREVRKLIDLIAEKEENEFQRIRRLDKK